MKLPEGTRLRDLFSLKAECQGNGDVKLVVRTMPTGASEMERMTGTSERELMRSV